MAVVTVLETPSYLVSNLNSASTQTYQFTFDNDTPAGTDRGVPEAAFNYTNNLPISINSESKEVMLAPQLIDDYYTRIHIIPSSINAGSVPSYKEEDFQVWNAFLTQQTIYEVDTTGDNTGVDLSGDIATVYERLELRDYTLQFQQDGPATIDIVFTFNFLSDSETLTVTGSRMALWPHKLLDGAGESLKFETWVFTSNDGTEQRAKMRQYPERNVTGESLLTQDEWRETQNIIYNNIGRRWGIMHDWEATKLTDTFNIGDTVVTFDVENAEYHAGGLACVYQDADNYHLSQIESVNSDSITLETAFQSALSGETWVAPVSTAHDAGKISSSKDGAGNHRVNLNFRIFEGEDLTGQAEDQSYNGYYYITRENEGSDVSETVVKNVWINNFGGKADWGAKWDDAKPSKDYRWTLMSQDDTWWARLFIFNHQGTEPFYVPSFEPDLTVASTLGAGSLTITVVDDEYRLGGFNLKKHIRIMYPDGTEDLREVVSVADSGGNTVCTLSSVTSNVSSIAPGDLEVQFLNLVRIDGKASFEHYGHKSVCRFKVVEVQQ